ncbi:autoinducer binding domain-containing protein [Rhizobium grahamii]|uniref:autoinducer binding domain-containing protein n=1 Tax=Rhizobium grahamii TaxID=1120045 RepID=UPI0002FC28B4|nr:autoinducer binding domain-containing protein [Rhizobium grahamii]
MNAGAQLRRPAARASDPFSLVPSLPFPKAATEALAVEFSRFLDQADARSDRSIDLLSSFALSFDCPWLAYGPLRPTEKVLSLARRDPNVMNYPDEWLKRCAEMGYDRRDPIINKSRKRARAFRWSEAYNDASTTEIERRIFNDAAAVGLRSGISVPIHSSDGSFATMSFCSAFRTRIRHQNNHLLATYGSTLSLKGC